MKQPKTPAEIIDQAQNIKFNLWVNYSTPDKLKTRNRRLSLVQLLAARRLHPEAFKNKITTFADCIQYAHRVNN